MHSGTVSMQCMPRGRRRAAPRRPAAAAHRGRGPLPLSPGALPAPPTACAYSPTTCWCRCTASAAAQCRSTIASVPPVLRSQGNSHAPPILLLSACSTLPAATSFCPQYILTTRKAARRVHDSLLHDSGLGAAATISAGLAGREAPGGRRARRACTGICLHACLLLRGGARRAAWHALGFACMHESCWLAG